MHSWFLSLLNAAQKRPFACCSSEGLTLEMLVHLTFDRIISSIIEKKGVLQCGDASFSCIVPIYNCFFS